jgi:hypothetical protein
MTSKSFIDAIEKNMSDEECCESVRIGKPTLRVMIESRIVKESALDGSGDIDLPIPKELAAEAAAIEYAYESSSRIALTFIGKDIPRVKIVYSVVNDANEEFAYAGLSSRLIEYAKEIIESFGFGYESNWKIECRRNADLQNDANIHGIMFRMPLFEDGVLTLALEKDFPYSGGEDKRFYVAYSSTGTKVGSKYEGYIAANTSGKYNLLTPRELIDKIKLAKDQRDRLILDLKI